MSIELSGAADFKEHVVPVSSSSSDVVIAMGLSVHFFGKTVGIFSTRSKSSRGFAELTFDEVTALLEFLQSAQAQEQMKR